MDAYYKKTKQIWFEYLIKDGPFTNKLIPKTPNDIKSVEYILLSYVKNISDDVIQSKIYTFAKANLSAYYTKMLTNRRWSNRMNTLYRIVDFRLDNLVDVCLANEQKLKTPQEQFQLFKIQSLFRKERLLQLVTTPHSLFSEVEYKQVFSLMGEDMLDILFHQFEQLPKSAQYAFIEVFSSEMDVEQVNNLESLLGNEDAEVRIRALKGIERVGVISDLDTIIPFVKSAMWEERLMVSKVLQHVPPLRFSQPYLVELLNDSNGDVQKEAALAVMKEKSGVQLLHNYANQINNENVKKIIREMVMEGR